MSETATPVVTPSKRGRKPGENPAPKKPGFAMKQLSTCVNDSVKNLSAQLQDKESNIYVAGVLVFASLSVDDQFKVLIEAKKLHALRVKQEHEAEGK